MLTAAEQKILNEYRVTSRGLQHRYNLDEPWTWVVPESCRQRVMATYHTDPSAGHPGYDETARAIRRLYHWTGLTRDVCQFIRTCFLSTSIKPHHRVKDHQTARELQRAWEVVALDLMGLYPRTNHGNRYILVATDV